jgi:glycosyltransferase involved in cell wall biosynthesis
LRLTVLIPAFNEEKTIKKVIDEIPKEIPSIDKIEILVIDDGSSDETARISKESGAEVISFRQNQGRAKAVSEGFKKFLETGSDILVLTDADDQYDSGEIPLVVNPIVDKTADMVLGDRQVKKLDHMKFGNKIGNRMVTRTLSSLIKMKISDGQSGFRAYTREAVAKLHIFSSYTFTQETLIETKFKGLKMVNVPVTFRKRADKSRLISNIFSYASKTLTIVAATIVYYRAVKFFGILAAILFTIGISFSVFVLNHFYATGSVTPYYPSTMLAMLFLIVGAVSTLMAVISSILGRQSILLEEILYNLRINNSESSKQIK